VRSGIRLVTAAAVLAAAGCATPIVYGPIGQNGYGYSDRQNPDGSYTVLVVASSPQQAHEFWDRRAAELCGGVEVHKNIFRAEIPVVTTTGYASNPYNPAYGGSYSQDVYGALQMEGYLRCGAVAADPAAGDDEPAPEEAVVTTP
jgi:hypothetical protein